MPKIDITAVPQRQGAGYPPPFDAPCAERVRRRGDDSNDHELSGIHFDLRMARGCPRADMRVKTSRERDGERGGDRRRRELEHVSTADRLCHQRISKMA